MRATFRLLSEHLLPALVIGVVCAVVFNNWQLVGVALLTGWLIDADHLVDFSYFLWRRKIANLDFTTVTSGSYFKSNGKVIVPLHSWELVVFWVIYWLSLGEIGIAITGALAWIVHLVHDQISYRVVPLGYFALYRAYRNFTHAGFCRG